MWSYAQTQSAAGQDVRSAMAEIQKVLDGSVEATRTKNIDLYMRYIPADMGMHDKESGKTMSRDDLRKEVLQQWSIIKDTVLIFNRIDQIDLQGDTAKVWTSQRWERHMFQRDGKTVDYVVTTQKHREDWRKIDGEWRNHAVEELGGEIFINGKPYHE
jgi:hypothetical protein